MIAINSVCMQTTALAQLGKQCIAVFIPSWEIMAPRWRHKIFDLPNHNYTGSPLYCCLFWPTLKRMKLLNCVNMYHISQSRARLNISQARSYHVRKVGTWDFIDKLGLTQNSFCNTINFQVLSYLYSPHCDRASDLKDMVRTGRGHTFREKTTFQGKKTSKNILSTQLLPQYTEEVSKKLSLDGRDTAGGHTLTRGGRQKGSSPLAIHSSGSTSLNLMDEHI